MRLPAPRARLSALRRRVRLRALLAWLATTVGALTTPEVQALLGHPTVAAWLAGRLGPEVSGLLLLAGPALQAWLQSVRRPAHPPDAAADARVMAAVREAVL